MVSSIRLLAVLPRSKLAATRSQAVLLQPGATLISCSIRISTFQFSDETSSLNHLLKKSLIRLIGPLYPSVFSASSFSLLVSNALRPNLACPDYNPKKSRKKGILRGYRQKGRNSRISIPSSTYRPPSCKGFFNR